jgi:hypothetical protein
MTQEIEEDTEEGHGYTDAEIGRMQGVTRQAVNRRRALGWTEEQILAGVRTRGPKEPGRALYNSKYVKTLKGFTAEAVAHHMGVPVVTVYARMKAGRPIYTPDDDLPEEFIQAEEAIEETEDA